MTRCRRRCRLVLDPPLQASRSWQATLGGARGKAWPVETGCIGSSQALDLRWRVACLPPLGWGKAGRSQPDPYATRKGMNAGSGHFGSCWKGNALGYGGKSLVLCLSPWESPRGPGGRLPRVLRGSCRPGASSEGCGFAEPGWEGGRPLRLRLRPQVAPAPGWECRICKPGRRRRSWEALEQAKPLAGGLAKPLESDFSVCVCEAGRGKSLPSPTPSSWVGI